MRRIQRSWCVNLTKGGGRCRMECLSWSDTTHAALKALLEGLGRSLLITQSAFALTLTETPQTLCDLLVISALRFVVVGFNQLQHHLSVMQMCFCCPVKHCGVSQGVVNTNWFQKFSVTGKNRMYATLMACYCVELSNSPVPSSNSW